MAAPVRHTCPDIDKCIKWLRSAIKDAEYGMKQVDRNSVQWDILNGIINQIEDIEPILETLRESNDELRTWGKECESEIQSLNNYISELEEKIENNLELSK